MSFQLRSLVLHAGGRVDVLYRTRGRRFDVPWVEGSAMNHWARVFALVSLLGGGWMAVAWHSAPSAARAAKSTQEWIFDVAEPEIFPGREPVTGEPQMLALLMGVDNDGGLALERLTKLPGIAPESREKPDWGRIYRWEVRSVAGQVLSSGRHFDPLFVYTPRRDGGCDKSLLAAHDMLMRVPWVEGAATVVVTIESTRTDMENGG